MEKQILKYTVSAAALIGALIITSFAFRTQPTLTPNTSAQPEPIPQEDAGPQSQTEELPLGATNAPATGLTETVAGFFSNCRTAKDSGSCMDAYFKDFLKTYTTKEALAAVQTLEDTDTTIRIACHEVVHAIGRETFAKEKTIHDSFAACNQTCHSGCYHGAMERFLRGDNSQVPDEEQAHISEIELSQKITTACVADDPINLRFQCLHGLGHAVMFYIDYDLPKALGYCDKLSTSWNQASCWGGAFMENVHSATPEKRYLSKTDYHFPCNAIDPKYRSDCYVMQTTRMAEMGLTRTEIIDECKKTDSYRLQCLQSLGRDSSNDVRAGSGASIIALCESISDSEGLRACLRGVAYALTDNTWDGTYVFPFCKGFKDTANQQYCYSLSVSYLKSMLLVTKEKIQADCSRFVPENSLCKNEAEKL